MVVFAVIFIQIPCGNCEKTYIGETGRKFGIRLKERKTAVEWSGGNNKQIIHKKSLSIQFVRTE